MKSTRRDVASSRKPGQEYEEDSARNPAAHGPRLARALQAEIGPERTERIGPAIHDPGVRHVSTPGEKPLARGGSRASEQYPLNDLFPQAQDASRAGVDLRSHPYLPEREAHEDAPSVSVDGTSLASVMAILARIWRRVSSILQLKRLPPARPQRRFPPVGP